MRKLSTLEKFTEFYDDAGIEMVSAVGFDSAILGIDEHSMRLIYSRKKIIKILMKQNSWDELEARDFFAYNIFDSYIGEQTPIFCLDDI